MVDASLGLFLHKVRVQIGDRKRDVFQVLLGLFEHEILACEGILLRSEGLDGVVLLPNRILEVLILSRQLGVV